MKNLFGTKKVTYYGQPDEPRPDLTPRVYEEPKRPGIDMGNLDVSMYNPRADQTDSEPWVGAGGDLWDGSQKGLRYVAVPRMGEYDPTPMYPMGSMMEIGGKLYGVRDLMGAYADGKPQWNTNRVDLFHPDESDAGYRHAIQFGRQSLPVRYFQPGEDPYPLN